MDQSKRQELIEQLRKGICAVTFTKVDGTEKTMRCTLKEDLLPPPSKDDPLTQKKVRNITEDVLVVYCTDKNEFRSFRINNLIKIEFVMNDAAMNPWFDSEVVLHNLTDGCNFDEIGWMTDSKTVWTDEQIENLNYWQSNGQFHPFTCPGNYPECHDRRELIATKNGWVCQCGKYTQDWAHDFMMGDSNVEDSISR